MSHNTPKQTPFDDLVPNPRTPSTPAPQGPPPANNTLPLSGRANAPATRVVARLQDDEPDDTPNTPNTAAGNTTTGYHPTAPLMPRRVLPTGTLVGLAMVGGAVIVLALSALFMRVVPRTQTKSLPPPLAQPRIAESPVEDSDVLTPDEEAEAARRAQSSGESDVIQNSSSSSSSASSSSGTTAAGTARGTTDGVADETTISDGDTDTNTGDSDNSPARTTPRTSTNSSDSNTRSSSRSNFEHEATGYRIQPPGGFRLQKTGRRTVWSGPRGSQFLVETSNSPGASPRADWEQLDKALAKKYGSRYRSLGISETTLAGRPAAVWEFEIGNTRKVDVAVHHRGKGYAVLAEAPVEDFETLRPQLESAIRSFELPARSTRSSNTRSTTTRPSSTRRSSTRSSSSRRSTPGTESKQNSRSDNNNDEDESRSGY